MKRIQTLIACALALAVVSVATQLHAVGAEKQTKATVRAVHGIVTYSTGGAWMTLKPNTELKEGAIIKTAPDSYADLSVNGQASVIRVTPETTLTLDTMTSTGFGGDTKTKLDLKQGMVIGSVKKITASSEYHIQTPNGVAGIRGTDFNVQVILNTDGSYTVNFTSVTGEVICSALVNNNAVVKVLKTGESWTPGGDVVPAAQALLDLTLKQITDLSTIAVTAASVAAGNTAPTVPITPPNTSTDDSGK